MGEVTFLNRGNLLRKSLFKAGQPIIHGNPKGGGGGPIEKEYVKVFRTIDSGATRTIDDGSNRECWIPAP